MSRNAFHQSFNSGMISLSLTRLDLAYLAQMTKDQWSTDSKNGEVGIAGIAAASYESFTAQRDQLFQQTSLNLSYFQTINMSSITLDPGAYDVIKECLKTQAARQQGLTYVVTAHNDTDVSIRFYWNPTIAPYELPVRAVAANAKTLDPDAKGDQLFAPGTKITPDGPVLELTRTAPTKPIRIVLKTTPPVGHDPIYIDQFEPSPKYKDSWVLSTYVDNPDPERYKTGEENFNSIYDRSSPMGGPIVSVDCSFNAAYYHMELCQPVTTSTLHCRANKQRSDTRSLWATKVLYLQPIKKCVANCGVDVHPVIDEDNPANYSFNAEQQLTPNLVGCSWKAAKVH